MMKNRKMAHHLKSLGIKAAPTANSYSIRSNYYNSCEGMEALTYKGE